MFEVDFKILNQKATPAIYADTLALRPAASFAGRLFVATDSPYGVFRDTGSAWVQVAAGTGGSGSTGSNGLNGTTTIRLGGALTQTTAITGAFQLSFNNQNFDCSSNFRFTNLGYATTNNYCNIVASDNILDLYITNSSTGFNSGFNIYNNKIRSKFSNGLYGLSLDDTNGKFALGDYSNGRKYNSIVVNDDTDRFYFTTSYNQANTNQDLLYASNNTSANERFVKLGDFNNYAQRTSLIIDDTNSWIYTNFFSGTSGIFLNDSYTFLGANNSTYFCALNIDYIARTISARDTGNVTKGLNIDFANQVYEFGDTLFSAITCDVLSQNIDFKANDLSFRGASLQSSTASGNSGEHLVISLNGSQYKIRLENP
jgi:hypothetical protein